MLSACGPLPSPPIGYGGLLEVLSCAGLVMASLLLIRQAVRPVGSRT